MTVQPVQHQRLDRLLYSVLSHLAVDCTNLSSCLICRWLDGACDPEIVREAHPRLSEEKIDALVKNAVAVQSCLIEDQVRRRQFWRSLLCEAGLRPYLKESD